MEIKQSLLIAALVSAVAPFATASSEGGPSEADKKFSPYAQSTMPRNVYRGDSHLHTGLSLDAGLFGNTLAPMMPGVLPVVKKWWHRRVSPLNWPVH